VGLDFTPWHDMIASCQDASQSFIVLRWYSSRYDVFCSMATLVFLCFSHGYLVLQLIKATKNYMKLVCILVHGTGKISLNYKNKIIFIFHISIYFNLM
jgi:hypothetical protein